MIVSPLERGRRNGSKELSEEKGFEKRGGEEGFGGWKETCVGRGIRELGKGLMEWRRRIHGGRQF